MGKSNSEDIVQEMTQLLDKMAVESFEVAADTQDTEAVLVNLKTINARYDKNEAISHIQALMIKYNIQIDELLEQIRY
jgi:hypothetical protein